MNIIAWIIIGGLAGWLAGIITRGTGYGCLGNIVVGIIGSMVGGWLFGLFGRFPPGDGFLGSLITAVIGAVVLIVAVRVLSRGR